MQLTLYSCQILIKIDFSRQIFKYIRMSNFIRNRQVERTLFHADKRNDGRKYRQTDMMRLLIAFHTFVKAHYN